LTYGYLLPPAPPLLPTPRGPPSHNPEAHKLYSNLAACYTKLGAYPEGIKAADRCIELAPEFTKGYSRKGTLQFLMKEYNKVGRGCAKGGRALQGLL
jgi:stress-induced-phosphoprotein 1